jgi:endonuclease/exonuclease/phosphatase (EEP) superfamily protein YafD
MFIEQSTRFDNRDEAAFLSRTRHLTPEESATARQKAYLRRCVDKTHEQLPALVAAIEDALIAVEAVLRRRVTDGH